MRDPILDLSLMRLPSFGTSVVAGALTRITQGAHPFLLPLMLQLGFGLSAAQSGTIIIATAIGSVSMKAFASRLLRRFRLPPEPHRQRHRGERPATLSAPPSGRAGRSR